MKICFACKKPQPLSEYQKDNRKLDGLRGSCKTCVNAKRRKTPWHDFIIKPITETIRPVIKEPKPIKTSEPDIFQSLQEKFDSHFSISVSKNLKTIIQVHGDTGYTFKGNTPKEALKLALA